MATSRARSRRGSTSPVPLPITTDRLTIRRFEESDVDGVLRLSLDPTVHEVADELGSNETEVLAYIRAQLALDDFQPGALFDLALTRTEDGELLGKHTGFKIGLAYGGTDYEKQRRALQDGVDLLIGNHELALARGDASLTDVADPAALGRRLRELDRERQTALFCAQLDLAAAQRFSSQVDAVYKTLSVKAINQHMLKTRARFGAQAGPSDCRDGTGTRCDRYHHHGSAACRRGSLP